MSWLKFWWWLPTFPVLVILVTLTYYCIKMFLAVQFWVQFWLSYHNIKPRSSRHKYLPIRSCFFPRRFPLIKSSSSSSSSSESMRTVTSEGALETFCWVGWTAGPLLLSYSPSPPPAISITQSLNNLPQYSVFKHTQPQLNLTLAIPCGSLMLINHLPLNSLPWNKDNSKLNLCNTLRFSHVN